MTFSIIKSVVKNRIVLALFTTAILTSCISINQEGYPKATICNGFITASVATQPHRKDNFYQGQRFDYSGIIYDLRCNGHSYFGQWFETVNPTFHDNVCGPVDEFGEIGYDNTKVGGEFLKIGVGVLRKMDSSPYNFRANYELVDSGKWECVVSKNAVHYRQTLNSKIASYLYEKTIELVPNSPTMKIRHTLKNIGSKRIDTFVYCHNFFMLDNEPAGKPIQVKFAYNPTGCIVMKDTREFSEFKKNIITFKGTPRKDMFVLYNGFDGENKVENYDFILENKKTGASVRITCDKPLQKVTFWSCTNTYCIEPFNKIAIAPNEEFSWTTTYQFSENK